MSTPGRADGGSRLFTRRRAVVVVGVLAFVAVFAAVGLVSRSSPTTTTSSTAGSSGPLPYEEWYWTMAVAPSSPDTLVVGTNAGLFRSTDGGTSWHATGPADVNATSLLDDGQTIYLGGARIKPDGPPIIRSGNGRVAANGASVFASSSDGGATWQLLHPRGLPNLAIQALALDPGHDALYALLNTGALYRSTDAGASFALVSPRLAITPWALAITANSEFVGGDMDHGDHLSADAKAWQQIAFRDTDGGQMVMEYAVEPTAMTHIVMTSDGILLSTDGGKSWHVVLKTPTMFGPVAFAPSSPELVYAVGFNGSLYRSSDAGASWSEVS